MSIKQSSNSESTGNESRWPDQEVAQAYENNNDGLKSISGDVDIKWESDSEDAFAECAAGSIEEFMNATCENDGWEEGYDY